MSFRWQFGRPAVDVIARLGRQLAHLEFPRDAPQPLPMRQPVERASAVDGDFARIQRWTQWVRPQAVRSQTAFWVVPPHAGLPDAGASVQDGMSQ